MKLLKKLFKHKIISELSLINKEIKYYHDLKDKSYKPRVLSIDKKRIDNIYSKLLQLSYIKSDIENRYQKMIILKLNKFPLNIPCSSEIICNKTDITFNELQSVIYESSEYKQVLSGWKIIIFNKNMYYEHYK